MSAGGSHFVEDPYAEGNLQRQAIGKGCFDGFLRKLPDSFGGATNFLWAPWTVAEQRGVQRRTASPWSKPWWKSSMAANGILGAKGWRGRFSRMKSSSALKKSGGCDG